MTSLRPFALVAGLLFATEIAAQEEVLRTDHNTQISSIGFRFVTSRSFPENEIRSKTALTERGSFTGLRESLDFFPLIEPVGVHPFDPLELQKDVARLRRFYHQSGFLDPLITYTIDFDREKNLVDVEYVIDEGPPLTLGRVSVTGADSATPLLLPPDLEPSWEDALSGFLPDPGKYLNLSLLPAFEASALVWCANHGYPFATARSGVSIDTASHIADLNLRMTPGQRSRIGRITVTGQQNVDEGILLRELPFATGDFYSAKDLAEGRREILSLGLFRRAMIGIPDGTPAATEVPVSLDVTEAPPRMIVGAVGYDSRGGMTLQADWTHRNFTGDARSFTTSGLAQSGFLAVEQIPEILYRASLSFTQPYVYHRRLSLIAGPFVEYRNDYRDRSNAYGLSATLVYNVDPLRSIALRQIISKRNIQEVRFGDYESGAIDFLSLLSTLAKGKTVLKNTIALQASYGSLDDIMVPRKGYLVRPVSEVTWAPDLNSVEYWRGELSGAVFTPFSETVGLAVRGYASTIVPFGKGLPQGEETSTEKWLQFRDIAATAGGPDDARGWGSRLLGPKFPNLTIQTTGTDTIYSVDGYIPVGGLAKLAFTFELRFPFPGLGSFAGLSVYLDGARVWNPQASLQPDLGWGDEEGWFYGVGTGMLFGSPVGTFRLDLGYKLNPSFQDLHEASDVVDALVNQRPLDQIAEYPSRRFHVHLSISVSF